MKQVKLTQDKIALVDDDFKFFDVPFHASKVKNKFYARTSRTLLAGSIRTYLHQLVIGCPINNKWMICFKDGNTLNCQRTNLEYIRKSDNTQRHSKTQLHRNKTSIYLGVTLKPAVYRARIYYDKKQVIIGEYKTEIEAAKAYDKYAKKLFGEKAKINQY